jgi:hypothetical protein
MEIHSRISLFSISAALLLALYLPSQSFGGVSATLYPADTYDSIYPYYNTAETHFSRNTGPIVSNEQYSHTNSIEVNHGTGSIRGYSGYRLDTARAVTRTGNLISTVAGSNEAAYVANVTGSIMYGTTVNCRLAKHSLVLPHWRGRRRVLKIRFELQYQDHQR